jgi:Ser/Thr protein kinase RdoA (MazF antagonist)
MLRLPEKLLRKRWRALPDVADKAVGGSEEGAPQERAYAAIRAFLPRYQFADDSGLSLLNVSENLTLLVSDRHSARRAVLRVHRPGYHTYEAISSELSWIEALRSARIVETAAPLRDGDGREIQTLDFGPDQPARHAVMFEYLSGVEPKPDDAGLPAWFEKLGELTAHLHSHARAWQRPQGFVRHVWDTDSMHGSRHLWGPWQDALGLTAEGHQVLGVAVDRIADVLDRYGKTPERFGLIHADLRLANLLVEGSSLKVLDFDDMGFSWFFYDFASAVSFFEDAPHIPQLVEAWLKGYSRKGSPQASDVQVLPTLVMARRVLLTAWVASHADAPFPRQLGKSFTDGTVQLARRYLNGDFLGAI